jgi:hypothetical protein
MTRAEIDKLAGLPGGTVARFVRCDSLLYLATLQVIVDVLGLELVKRGS